ncbi:type II CAAX prenyl endopeptidase Rce1 family protein [Primorskyibacter sp. 2E107]|uniref:CPBP family intramembrane glutamic endopeptidase n=1 Tax=Primorskyibacter sp. 2E107 TaxID=3403458 RepID=UPI003AF6C6B8
MVDIRDIADAAVAEILRRHRTDAPLPATLIEVCGPEVLTAADAATIWTEALGHQVSSGPTDLGAFEAGLPQELIDRTLFFQRYAAILPKGSRATVLNATLFALAHLMFWNWVVLSVSFIGGLLFARSYRQRGLVEAWVLHGLTGFVRFAVGVGWYFTPEASARPF